MVFSSAVFLFIFLPLVFTLYLPLPSIKLKNTLLVIASLFFYAFGEPLYILLMLVSVVLNYTLGLLAAKFKCSKLAIILAVIINIALLAAFKYTDFIIVNLNALLTLSIPVTGIRLPIGISFFTFQALSYVIDVCRDSSLCQRNILKLTLFISFFPQLIAGPIVKYGDIAEQINSRHSSIEDIAKGLRRFITGLSKKLLIANTAGLVADTVFNMNGGNIICAWVGAILYCLQIYYDFSGYSDMAIGLGRVFGFHIKENFDHPYAASSIQDFWRGWHISLSGWFREYLYIPLGGNRCGRLRTTFNKYTVFLLTGLWHGASWNFVLWGLVHGTFLVLEDGPLKPLKRRKIAGRIYTLVVIICAFVLFRADSLDGAFAYIGNMFAGFAFEPETMSRFFTMLSPWLIFSLAAGIIFAMPVKKLIPEKLFNTAFSEAVSYTAVLALFMLCILNLASTTFNPFIYFRF